MTIAIVGLGAVGSALLYRFLRSSMDAVAVVRSRSIDRVSRGLRLVDVDGSLHEVHPRTVIPFERLEEVGLDSVEVVFVCTKVYDLAPVLEKLSRVSSPACVVTVQNGFDPHGEALKLFGQRAVHAVTTIAATRLDDSTVRVHSWGRFVVGSRLGTTVCVERVAQVLDRAGFEVQTVSDIDGWIWRKLAINACINPLTALLRVRNGALRLEPLYTLCRDIVVEVIEVAKRLGIDIGDVVDELDRVLSETSGNLSSMLQDVLRGRRTEIDWICGAVTRLGKEVGLRTPLNEALWRLVKALEVLGSESLSEAMVARALGMHDQANFR